MDPSDSYFGRCHRLKTGSSGTWECHRDVGSGGRGRRSKAAFSRAGAGGPGPGDRSSRAADGGRAATRLAEVRGPGPIGLTRIGGDDFELVHPRGVRETELDYEEGMEIWKAGDPESARDALRYALSACHDNIWIHVALGQIALEEFRDPSLARGHFGYAFELAERALPPGFAGRLPRDRPQQPAVLRGHRRPGPMPGSAGPSWRQQALCGAAAIGSSAAPA